jgi:glycosyltransferase involved in cell wall biosynthesis
VSVRQIPPSRLFQPTCFLSAAGPAYARYTQTKGEEAGVEAADAEAVRAGADFLQTAVCRELVHAANRIDPAIDFNRYSNGNWWGTRTFPIHAGIAYYRLCQALGSDGPFSDIVLAPSKDSPDVARYIAEVLCGLAWSGQAASVLVLAEQEAELELLRGLLPHGTVLVSMYPLHPQLTEDDVDALTIKVLQAAAAKARLHFGRSVYAARFWRRFGPLLRDNRAILYRLGEDRRTVDGREFLVDEDFNFISDCLGTLDTLLSSNQGIIARDQARIGTMQDKWRLLPVPVAVAPVVRDHGGFHYRLAWLAQPEEVDRTGLPIAIAAVLASRGLNVRIDPWSGAIDPSQIDAVLCTAKPSGLRRPLLQAMAAGLPIIARQTGGLDDLVLDGQTGLTLKGALDEPALADSCVTAIKYLYNDTIRYAMLSRQARELVETQYGTDKFLAKLKEIFSDADAARAG